MKTKRYDLYGIALNTLQGTAERLTQELDINFEPHESSYKGGEYYRHHDGEQEITIEHNWVDEEGYHHESEHRQYKILVYVNRASRGVYDQINRLDFTERLRSEEF